MISCFGERHAHQVYVESFTFPDNCKCLVFSLWIALLNGHEWVACIGHVWCSIKSHLVPPDLHWQQSWRILVLKMHSAIFWMASWTDSFAISTSFSATSRVLCWGAFWISYVKADDLCEPWYHTCRRGYRTQLPGTLFQFKHCRLGCVM